MKNVVLCVTSALISSSIIFFILKPAKPNTDELINRITKLEAFKDSCAHTKHKLFKVGVRVNGEWYPLHKCPVWTYNHNGKRYDMENGHSLTPGEENKRIVNTPNGTEVLNNLPEDNISYEWR